MSEPIDAHTLNACLARVVGLRWGYDPELNEHGYFDADDNFRYQRYEWNPLHNANQMEEVEAWLVGNGIYPSYSLEYTDLLWRVYLSIPGKIIHQHTRVYTSKDPDKKRAFALAVQAMEQSQKGTT